MSRSYRRPYAYTACGACPWRGKRFTSKRIRAHVRAVLRTMLPDADLPPFEGRTRGHGGSRSPDRGWDFFGDGRSLVLAVKEDGHIYDHGVRINSRK